MHASKVGKAIMKSWLTRRFGLWPWTVALLAVGLILAACQEAPRAPVLRFTAIRDDNTAELRRKFEPLADYLAERLDVPVEYVPSADYGASVEMFKNGDVQLAWFGGLTGAQARAAVSGALAIAQGEEDQAYYSYFVANASTGIERSESFPTEIAKRSFSFGSASSTSGRLMPEYYLRRETGKSPRDFFEQGFSFSGSHAQTLALVAAGTVEVGVVNYRTYLAKVASGDIDPERVRVIWQTPTYADYNFTVRPDLVAEFGPGFLEKLRAALLNLEDPGILEALQRSRLVAASNAEYHDLEVVARSLDLLR